MNAEEARVLTQNHIQYNMPLLRKKIEALIERSARKGELVAHFVEHVDCNIRARLMAELRADGFTVEYHSSPLEKHPYLSISW